MFKNFIFTKDQLELTILRISLGLVIFAHGAQKLFGIWGGHGMEWTVKAWQQWWAIPSLLTYAVIFIESIGAILLIIGIATRLWAILISIIMIIAIYLVHLKWGFFMNWYMQPQTGEGFEYHLLVLTITTVLIYKGGGKYSGDLFVYNRINNYNV